MYPKKRKAKRLADIALGMILTVVDYGVERITMGRTSTSRSAPDLAGSWPEVEVIRREAFCRGCKMEDLKNLADAALQAVYEQTGRDVDLTVTAICMSPRPKWVEELLGC